ncbi:MAG: glycosyltransferase family 4 protein [Acidimicrobiia bacterium]
MPQSLDIVYHNPSVARPGQWAGERGRQLITAMGHAGSSVQAIPPPAQASIGETKDSAGRRLLSRVPPALRGPLITLRLIQRGTVNTLKWSWRLWRRLRSNPPDVLLARYHEYEWTPLVVARLLQVPLVLEVHSPFALEGTFRGRRPSRLAHRMDRTFWRKASLLWVHTPALRDLVLAEGGDEQKIRLVPFGIEDPGRRAVPGSGGSVEVVFAGSFYPWHGIEELLIAFALARSDAPDLRLTLIGDGATHNDAAAQAEPLGVAAATTFTGWLSRDDLYKQLERSHLGVAPYRDTGKSYFEPVKILDYQMAGLPIIASSVGHIPQMIVDGEDGLLVPPDDIEALATAIVELAGNAELRRDLGAAANGRARHIEETAAAVLEMCRTVTS